MGHKKNSWANITRWLCLCWLLVASAAVEGQQGYAIVNNQIVVDRQRHWEGQPIIVRANDVAVGRANGDVGVIVRREGALVAAFPGPDALPASDSVHSPDHLRLVDYLSLARLPAHETCFAMTIHKSQGSQWPHITVVLPDYASPILTRELIYTAITRARETATVLGAEAVLAHALERPAQRASGLLRSAGGSSLAVSLVRGGIHHALRRTGDADLEQPATTVWILIDHLRGILEGLVDLTRDRSLDIGDRLDALDLARRAALAQRSPDLCELDMNHIAHGVLGEPGDAHCGHIAVDADPLMGLYVLQICGVGHLVSCQ